MIDSLDEGRPVGPIKRERRKKRQEMRNRERRNNRFIYG
jgi:hypothetical protein